ncbi:AlpA family phage regulatory protein [Paraburkholderia sp. Tr-20389]|nr:AlpA family phage regulatory protein [Paraburkholderia sp. Tr-20389]
MSQRIIRCPDVCGRIGVSRSSLYRLVAVGEFPQPVKLSTQGRAVGWLATDVDRYIEARAATRPVA